MAVKIAITNEKGGTGKTTTAVNLGAALALGGQRVLIMDLDAGGDATMWVGRDFMNQPGTGELLAGRINGDLAGLPVPTGLEGLRLLPGGPELKTAEARMYLGQVDGIEGFRTGVGRLEADYDYMVMDCPPSSSGLIWMCGWSVADYLLIPMVAEALPLHRLSKMLKTIEIVRAQGNAALKLMGVLLVRYRENLNLTRAVLADLEKVLAGKVLDTKIPQDVRLAEAPIRMIPGVVCAPDSAGSGAYRELAEEVMRRGRQVPD